MKMYLWSLVVMLVSVTFLKGQTPSTPPLSYQPGQTIVVTVTFEGPDKVIQSSFCFGLQSASLPSQAGFSSQICSDGASFKMIGPGTFNMWHVIPDTQATGTYRLNQISAGLDHPSISFTYGADELPNRMVKIENSNTVTKPKIKDVQVH